MIFRQVSWILDFVYTSWVPVANFIYTEIQTPYFQKDNILILMYINEVKQMTGNPIEINIEYFNHNLCEP